MTRSIPTVVSRGARRLVARRSRWTQEGSRPTFGCWSNKYAASVTLPFAPEPGRPTVGLAAARAIGVRGFDRAQARRGGRGGVKIFRRARSVSVRPAQAPPARGPGLKNRMPRGSRASGHPPQNAQNINSQSYIRSVITYGISCRQKQSQFHAALFRLLAAFHYPDVTAVCNCP